MQNYELFGGAITISLPSFLTDVAELRDVADTQEVFVEQDSTVSYMIDITQSVPVPIEEPRKAIEYHYESLAEENRAAESGIRWVEEKSELLDERCHGPTLLCGQQAVAKFRRSNDEADLVDIYMALWRMPSKNSEVVLTINVPHEDREAAQIAKYDGIFRQAAESLKIVDYGLFAG